MILDRRHIYSINNILKGVAIMEHVFDIPNEKKIRLVINSDVKIEADDQYAIVHALLSPRFLVKGIIGTHFRKSISVRYNFVSDDTVEQSYEEAKKLVRLMNLEDEIPVFKGAEDAIMDEREIRESEGADFIIQEALANDSTPLYVIFLGALTDLAIAYLKEPSIAGKFTAVWIGGAPYPQGGREANLNQDTHAANVVFDSDIPLWQIPSNVYNLMRIGIAELAYKVRPYGEIGNYLYQQLIDFNYARRTLPHWPKGESWILGDSPAISVLIDDHEGHYSMVDAPRVTSDGMYISGKSSRQIRLYDYIDPRFTFEDFFAKLALQYGSK